MRRSPNIEILTLNMTSQLKQPEFLGEIASNRAMGHKMYKMNLEHVVITENKKAIKILRSCKWIQ